MPSVLERLRERKLFQWTTAYLAAGWVVAEVLDLVGDRFHWPDWVLQAAIVLLLVGLLITLILAWYHGEKGRQRFSGGELLAIAVLLCVAAASVTYLRARAVADRPPDDRLPAVEAPGPGSVAVLAFRDLSPDGDQDYLAEGIAEEILTSLMELPSLRVAARTSAFSFKGTDTDIRTIGRRLGVRHVLEGTVQREGDRVRMRVHLIDARDGFRVWSNTYDRRLAAVIDTQEEIARSVVDELQVELAPGEEARLASQLTESPAAYDEYLRGRYFLVRRPEGLDRARELFERATILDPGFAAAYAQLATTYVLMGNHRRRSPAEVFPLARAAALRALELDPASAEAQLALALVRASYERDWEGAERAGRRALELKPGLPDIHNHRAYWLQAMGRFDEAVDEARAALELDPLSPLRYANLAEILTVGRRYDQAVRRLRRALEMAPDDPGLEAGLALVEVLRGRSDEGVGLAEDVAERTGDWVPLGLTSALAGRTSSARAALARLDPEAVYPGPALIAAIHAHLGEEDRAFELLELAYERYDSGLFMLNYPFWDPLREHPRFAELLDRLNLPVVSP